MSGDIPFAEKAEAIWSIFAECEAAQAKFGETKKPADKAAWRRKGGVLEVVCVGHMRGILTEAERLTALNAELMAALIGPGDQDLENLATLGRFGWLEALVTDLKDCPAAMAALSREDPNSYREALRETEALIRDLRAALTKSEPRP